MWVDPLLVGAIATLGEPRLKFWLLAVENWVKENFDTALL